MLKVKIKQEEEVNKLNRKKEKNRKLLTKEELFYLFVTNNFLQERNNNNNNNNERNIHEQIEIINQNELNFLSYYVNHSFFSLSSFLFLISFLGY